MRQLFLVDGVDADGRVFELGCIAETEDQAIRMLATEGYDVSVREHVELSGLIRRESTASFTAPGMEEGPASAPTGSLEAVESDESRASGSMQATNAEALRVSTVATLARDIAILDIYAAGLDVQTVARAVGATPRDIAIRLSHRALRLDVALLESAPTPPFGNSVDFAAVESYRLGMSVADIAEATGLPTLEVAWALMDDPARPVQVTRALVDELRAEMFRATRSG